MSAETKTPSSWSEDIDSPGLDAQHNLDLDLNLDLNLDPSRDLISTSIPNPNPNPNIDKDQDKDKKGKRLYHPKRPHRKSRTGCTNCKARKVKCDEARPICRSCTLRKTDCVYPQPFAKPSTSLPGDMLDGQRPRRQKQTQTQKRQPLSSNPSRSSFFQSSSTTTISSDVSPTPTSSSSPANFLRWPTEDTISPSTYLNTSHPTSFQTPLYVEPPYTHGPHIDEIDMRLLWFYTAHTSSCFTACHIPSNREPVQLAMRSRLIQYAFEAPFLMDSVLALSSLHLLSISPANPIARPIDLNRALAYRVRSFEGYRRAVQQARAETFPALIANSLLLTALSSHAFRDESARDMYILDWMVVWRGIGLIIQMMGIPSIVACGLHRLFYRPPMDIEACSPWIPHYLNQMVFSIIDPSDPDFTGKEIYRDTVRYLAVLYSQLSRSGPSSVMYLHIVTWLTFIPETFVKLANEKRPRALVILSHYAMFLKLCERSWWLKGVGQRSLIDLTNHLTTAAAGMVDQQLIVSPIEAVEIDDILMLVRHILGDAQWMPPQSLLMGLDDAEIEIGWMDADGKRVYGEIF